MAMATTQDQPNRKSVTDRANSAINTVRTAKTVVQTAQKLQKVQMAVSVIAANWEIVVILLAIAAVVIAFLIIFIAITGQGNPSLKGTLANLQITSQGVTPLPIDQVKPYIIIVDNPGAYTTNGETRDGETLTDDQKNFIYNTFALPLGSAEYKKLLSNSDGTPKPIYLYFYKPLVNGIVSGGANYGVGTMRFWGFFEFKDTKPTHPAMLQHILVHESGHIIDRRDGELGYNRTSLIASDNTECYNNYNKILIEYGGDKYMATYAFRDTDVDSNGRRIGGGADQESFAESIANNVYCKPDVGCDYTSYRSSTSIVYNGRCMATYDWIKQHVFGGDDFFASTTPTAGGNLPPNSNDCGVYAGWFSNVTRSDYYQCTGAWSGSDPSKYPVPQKYVCAPFLHNSAPNFGDPACETPTVGQIDEVLNQYDSANAAKWDAIVACESTYRPNIFSPISLSQLGAYGLVQMNPQGKSRNGPFDAGDVNWRQQLINAINYKNTKLGGRFNYWGCGG
jgi:hypothetical protein